MHKPLPGGTYSVQREVDQTDRRGIAPGHWNTSLKVRLPAVDESARGGRHGRAGRPAEREAAKARITLPGIWKDHD